MQKTAKYNQSGKTLNSLAVLDPYKYVYVDSHPAVATLHVAALRSPTEETHARICR